MAVGRIKGVFLQENYVLRVYWDKTEGPRKAGFPCTQGRIVCTSVGFQINILKIND